MTVLYREGGYQGASRQGVELRSCDAVVRWRGMRSVPIWVHSELVSESPRLTADQVRQALEQAFGPGRWIPLERWYEPTRRPKLPALNGRRVRVIPKAEG